MAPSTVPSPTMLDICSSDKEVFSAMWDVSRGSPLPQNVHKDIEPYQIRPSNLSGEVWWYCVKCNWDTNSSLGPWKLKGEDREVFSDSSFTGWITTYEFHEDHASQGRKIIWVMLKYWMTEPDKQKETFSLCKVFLEYDQFKNHEKIQKTDSAIISNVGAANPNHQLVVPGASKNMTKNGSTSKTEISGDDKMVGLPVAGSEDSRSEMDYVARGDYLEVNDLDDPASPSSSSDSSSCLTMSSDEKFDAMALLQDLDRDINAETMPRDGQCVRHVAPSKHKKVAVDPGLGPSESLVNAQRSDPPAEEKPKTNSTMPKTSPPVKGGSKEPDMKQLGSQGERAGNGLDAASSSILHSKTVSNGKETAMNGESGKKTVVDEVKKKTTTKKKYFCFI